MIPRSQTSTQAAQPQSSRSRQRKRDGYDYLKWEDIGEGNTKRGRILAARVQPDNFKPSEMLTMCKVAVEGKPFLYPLRSNNPNLDTLVDAFSDDENRWVDKEVIFSVDTDAFDGRHNIHVEPAPAQKGKK